MVVGVGEDLAGAEGLATEGAAGVDLGVAAAEAVADIDQQRDQRICSALFCKYSLCCCQRYVADILYLAVCVAIVMADDEQELFITVCTSIILPEDSARPTSCYCWHTLGSVAFAAPFFFVGVGLMPGITQGRLAVLMTYTNVSVFTSLHMSKCLL